jgi:hypothetical protein
MHIFNPSMREIEEGGAQVQGQPGYLVTPFPKRKQQQQNNKDLKVCL